MTFHENSEITSTSPTNNSHRTKLKVLIQGMNFSPELIGVGKYTGELANFLASDDAVVEVVTTHAHYPGFVAQNSRSWAYERSGEGRLRTTRCPLLLRRGGRGIWRFLAPLSFAVTSAPVLIWRALRFRPALILCVEPTLLAAPAAVLAARLLGAALVLHVQDLEIDAAFAAHHLRSGMVRSFALAAERWLLGAFDRVVTISDVMATRLAAKGVAPSRISVLRNWISAGLEADRNDQAARERFGIGPGERVVLYAGHLGAKQDIPGLLEALRRLAETPDVRIVIAGGGPMTSLVEAARPYLPNLTLLPLLPKPDFEALLALADVHVLPQDPRAADLVFPSKLGLMLATERPVVVTADAGSELARWLADAAIVVPAGKPAALAEGLALALNNRCERRIERAAALTRTLDADVILPAFHAMLSQAVEIRRSRTWRGLPGVRWMARPSLAEQTDPAPAG